MKKGLTKKEIEYWRNKLTIKDLVIICDMNGFKIIDVESSNMLDTQRHDLQSKISVLEHTLEIAKEDNKSFVRKIDGLSSQIELLKNIIIRVMSKE